MARTSVLVSVLLCLGCPARKTGETPAEPNGAAAQAAPRPSRAPVRAEAPVGYVEMHVLGVVDTAAGNAVLLASEASDRLLPIFVGGTEAMSIELRLRGEPFVRPLTHDLLDRLVTELGGRIVKVQVDGLEQSTFVGSVFLETNGEVKQIDARPSDAIALALGNKVPIYVAGSVLRDAGITRGELDQGSPPPAKENPPL